MTRRDFPGPPEDYEPEDPPMTWAERHGEDGGLDTPADERFQPFPEAEPQEGDDQ